MEAYELAKDNYFYYLKLASDPELSESDREYYNFKMLIWEEITEGMED